MPLITLQSLFPELVDVAVQRREAPRIRSVKPARTTLALGNETRFLQNTKVLGHRRPADGQLRRNFADGTGADLYAFENGPPRGVRKSLKSLFVSFHLP